MDAEDIIQEDEDGLKGEKHLKKFLV